MTWSWTAAGGPPANPGALMSRVAARRGLWQSGSMSVPERAGLRRYARPYVLPESLESLAGPVGGVVMLPRHLAWSGGAVYDLDSPGRVVDLYRTVIIEAASPEDLHAFLNAAVLRRLWSYLWLPPVVRQMWQARFADLAAIDALAASA
jgi:hypothetical protein